MPDSLMPTFFVYRLAHLIAPFVNWFFLRNASGLEYLPARGPYIIALNHVSIPDAWLAGNLLLIHRNIPMYFITRDDFWWGRWWTRTITPRTACLLIDWRKPRAVLDDAQDILRRNGVVCIFPEGSRNPDPNTLLRGKTGVARLAHAARCPVIPAGYEGPPIATVWDVINHFLLRRRRATIRFGPPIYFDEYYTTPVDRVALYAITDHVMKAIGALCNKRARLHSV